MSVETTEETEGRFANSFSTPLMRWANCAPEDLFISHLYRTFYVRTQVIIPAPAVSHDSFKLEVCDCVGGVISPMLSNIYLHAFDQAWEKSLGVLVRYADDFVVMCQRQSQVREAHRRIEEMLTGLGLTLNTEKTRLVNLGRGKEGFIFLGCMIRKRRSIQRNPRWHFMQRWPSPKAMKKVRERVRQLTHVRGNRAKGIQEVIKSLNPILRGWGNYFRSGNADREFNKMDHYVWTRLLRWQKRRGGQRSQIHFEQNSPDRLYGMGLHRLQGRTVYPAQAAPIRPSLSRVRENRMHGLKGGLWKPGLN